MPIFCVKSGKIYTGQKNLHWRRQQRLSGMRLGCILAPQSRPQGLVPAKYSCSTLESRPAKCLNWEDGLAGQVMQQGPYCKKHHVAPKFRLPVMVSCNLAAEDKGKATFNATQKRWNERLDKKDNQLQNVYNFVWNLCLWTFLGGNCGVRGGRNAHIMFYRHFQMEISFWLFALWC